MSNMTVLSGASPMPSGTIARFMALCDELCSPASDGVLVEVIAGRLGWPLGSVLNVAKWCCDRYLIAADEFEGSIRIIGGRPALRAQNSKLLGRFDVRGDVSRDDLFGLDVTMTGRTSTGSGTCPAA